MPFATRTQCGVGYVYQGVPKMNSLDALLLARQGNEEKDVSYVLAIARRIKYGASVPHNKLQTYTFAIWFRTMVLYHGAGLSHTIVGNRIW